MNETAIDELRATAKALVADGRGILAADESNSTISKRFAAIGVTSSEDARRSYRDVLFTTPGLSEWISGAILYDETIRQRSSDGRGFPELLSQSGMIPGIKVDTGAKKLALHPGELVTEGLDGLRERVGEYRGLGARFAKWRAVITVGDDLPSGACLRANAHALARYAALCQEGGLVPIVEPEVLMDGAHSLQRSYEVHVRTLERVFEELRGQDVALEGMLLKASMVVAGKDHPDQAQPKEVAELSIRCYTETVPAAVPGIVLLSGGQSDVLATVHLNEMNKLGPLPWTVSFSYGRALQDAALKAWAGDDAKESQAALAKRARANAAAARSAYSDALEAA
ncbi:MAG: class I fructose-bisphosphate aldolase [Acidimicrobiales bacterium]